MSDDDTPPLPPLHHALLDDTTLAALFSDVAGCTQLIEVVIKYAHHVQTPDGQATLADAQQKLADGTAVGAQLRYIHQGDQWWDTLVRTPQGMKLVRIRHAFTRPTDNPA